jgi:CO/xanthine dehydrogenase Mo-binding subunit
MKFDTPATTNPIDQLKIIGHPTNRIDGRMKTTGTATYAYEWHEVIANPAYGYVVGSAVAKGRINSIDLSRAKARPSLPVVARTSRIHPSATSVAPLPRHPCSWTRPTPPPIMPMR